MFGDTQIPRFDAGIWVKVARSAVAASALLSAVTVAILLMVDPPKQCPNWHLKDTQATSLWVLLAMWTAPLIVIGGFVAIRWNWVALRSAERAGEPVKTLFFGRVTPPTVPVTYGMISICVMNSVLSQFPLLFLVTQCTNWLRP